MYGAFLYTTGSKGNVDPYLMGVYDSVQSFDLNLPELKRIYCPEPNYITYPNDNKEIALKEGETMISLENLFPNHDHYYKHPLQYVEFTI